MKNVTGYDLVKLMAGSHGTLGCADRGAFKVLPMPETSALVSVAGLDAARAVEAMSAALTSPFDVTGAAHLSGSEPRTLIRVEGFEGSVKYRAERLQDLLGKFGDVDVSLSDKTNQQTWIDVRDVKLVADGQGDVWQDGPARRNSTRRASSTPDSWANNRGS
jgi:glycolate oxidase FAD binding subunit